MKNLIIIAGPCIIEGEETTFEIARKLAEISTATGQEIVFKASYRKANRTSSNSFSGIGDEAALEILKQVKKQFGFRIVTDVHESIECAKAAEVADIIQIPAFLCRQTALLVAAGETGKSVNIKKGQFLSPEAMKFAIEKVYSTGNKSVMLTERGTTFGYDSLIVDITAIPRMQAHGVPVIVDCTHSVQQPNQTSGVTGGNPLLIETIAKAATAAGSDGLFFEVHPAPPKSPSDAASILELSKFEAILRKCLAIRNVAV
ncbi:MAG: 3-deoxy-8-phosphooctulonate synthase [Bacteroidetes bacterium]|nr:3-deoxy-8-phosphooctulonate synthase [Bacteroidota bacterium]MBU1721061.1 3-deoxy-8-phosphooctulonate synthase [Bacteroidota bacterium]